MRLHGWCQGCHRVRMVTVRYPPLGGVPVGTCESCEESERNRHRRLPPKPRRSSLPSRGAKPNLPDGVTVNGEES